MTYTINKFDAPATSLSHNDKVVPQDGSFGYDTEEDGYPVVIMETGCKDLDGPGCEYHEKAGILTEPAKTAEEALQLAGPAGDGARYPDEEDPDDAVTLQPGDPDWWCVHVYRLIDEA